MVSLRYMELYIIMLGSSISISMELFIGPTKHTTLGSDGTIQAKYLHNVEHASISMTYLIYAVFAVIFDKTRPSAQFGLTHLVGAIAFAQQLFLIHFHTAYHMGIEEQYHLCLKFIVCVSLITTLMGISLPKSFLISFVRSICIAFQGILLIVMGYMVWTPSLLPKGCFLRLQDGHKVVKCISEEALHRAKSLVNIEFSWLLVGISISAMSFYVVLDRIYVKRVECSQLISKVSEDVMMKDDVETQKGRHKQLEETTRLVHIGKALAPFDMER